MGRERTNKKVESVVGYIEHKTICATMLQQIKNNFFLRTNKYEARVSASVSVYVYCFLFFLHIGIIL